MKLHRTPFAAVVVALMIGVAPVVAQTRVEVTNNQSFPIAMPLKLLGDDAPTVMVNVDANGKQTIEAGAKPQSDAARVVVEPVESGIRIRSGDRDLGTLAWDLLFDTIEKDVPDSQVDRTQREFDKLFQPLPMKFAPAGK